MSVAVKKIRRSSAEMCCDVEVAVLQIFKIHEDTLEDLARNK